MLDKAPTLETARFILRAHEHGDFDAFAELWADPVVTRFIHGGPRSRDESWLRFLRNGDLWKFLGFGYWAVEDKISGKFAGTVGFQDMKRAMTPSIEGLPEIGWVLAPAIHGKGAATEIVAALVAWSDAELSAEKTVCIIRPEHGASMRVAEKNGYFHKEMATFNDAPIVLLERPRRS